MKIHSLLNPFCGEPHDFRPSLSPVPASLPCAGPPISLPKRQKIPKDAPVFSEGNKTVGYVNYPPHEAGDDQNLAAQHRRFQIYPLGEIFRKGVRHIPYNSDKKDFLDKTGRDAFEMFQYTYKRPGEDKEYVVVWDYNVGLVRMTPFFKSCKYSKTIPAKALRENPGLKDISYSITGGALVCQGYWMPYDAAKAIAATFCYDIRWALVPVFGSDFPDKCFHPKNDGFAKFLIDPSIVQYCTMETNRFRTEGASYRISTSNIPSLRELPNMGFESAPWEDRVVKQRRARPTDIESGYGTDTDRHSDKYIVSPQVSPRSLWRSVNRSMSPSSPRTVSSSNMGSPVSTQEPPLIQLPTSVPGGYYDEPFRTKRTHSKVAFSDNCDDEVATRPWTAGTSKSDSCHVHDARHSQNDLVAAEIMLSLSSGDNMLLPPPTKRTRRGSTL